MTLEGFAGRLQRMRESYPTQVICGFLHPDGLEVFLPVSQELFEDFPAVGAEIMRLHNDAAEEARAAHRGNHA